LEAIETTAEAASTYSEKKAQQAREQERQRQQLEKEQEQQRIENGRKQISDNARSAKNSNVSVLWEMNCPACGIEWMTTKKRKIGRKDEYSTIGFNEISTDRYTTLDDRVEIQCDAPDCNNTKKFTKRELWK